MAKKCEVCEYEVTQQVTTKNIIIIMLSLHDGTSKLISLITHNNIIIIILILLIGISLANDIVLQKYIYSTVLYYNNLLL